MSSNHFKFTTRLIGFVIIAFLSTASLAVAQPLELEVKIADVGVEPGVNQLTVPVYMVNRTDTIFGFDLWLYAGSSEIYFDEQIDTVGTLISNWDMLQSQYYIEMQQSLMINARADSLIHPEYYLGTAPQTGEIPLFYLKVSLPEFTDSLSDQTFNLIINNYPWSSFFTLDNLFMKEVGVYLDTVYDDHYYRCIAWVDEICLQWERVQFPPYDSVYTDTSEVSILDSTKVAFKHGSVTIMYSKCGDVNGDNEIDISDITALISYLYLNGDIPTVMRVANADGSSDGIIDISDITGLIASLYLDHRELVCPYIPPEN